MASKAIRETVGFFNTLATVLDELAQKRRKACGADRYWKLKREMEEMKKGKNKETHGT